MKLIKGQIDEIEKYRNCMICFEHNLNIYHNTNNIYTLKGLGRTVQGTINDAKTYIDYMYEKYTNY